MLLQRRGVYVSGIGEQGTDQEPTCIENIKLRIVDYTKTKTIRRHQGHELNQVNGYAHSDMGAVPQYRQIIPPRYEEKDIGRIMQW